MANELSNVTRKEEYVAEMGTIVGDLTVEGNLIVNGSVIKNTNKAEISLGNIENGRVPNYFIDNDLSPFINSSVENPQTICYIETVPPGTYLLKASFKLNNITTENIPSSLSVFSFTIPKEVITDKEAENYGENYPNNRVDWDQANDKIVLIEKAFTTPAHYISRHNLIDIINIEKDTTLGLSLISNNTGDTEEIVIDKREIKLQLLCVGF